MTWKLLFCDSKPRASSCAADSRPIRRKQSGAHAVCWLVFIVTLSIGCGRKLSLLPVRTSFVSCLPGKRLRLTIRWKVCKALRRLSINLKALKRLLPPGRGRFFPAVYLNTTQHGSMLFVYQAKLCGRASHPELPPRTAQKDCAAQVPCETRQLLCFGAMISLSGTLYSHVRPLRRWLSQLLHNSSMNILRKVELHSSAT